MALNNKSLKLIHFVLILSALILFQNCAAGRKAKKNSTDLTIAEIPSDKKLSALLSIPLRLKDVTSLNAKASVDIIFQGMDQGVKSQIRWIRDSILWMNFSLIGIEGARLKVTRDSFYLIDRINKKFMAESLEKMSVRYDLPISFDNLQSVILGDPVILSKSEIVEEKKNEFIHFTQQDSIWRADYYTNYSENNLTKMNLRQKKSNHVLTHKLSDFKKLSGSKTFSFNRIVEFYSKATGQAKLNIEFKDISINTPKEIKFSIPSSYEKM